MAGWPGNPIANMRIDNGDYTDYASTSGVGCWIHSNSSAPNNQVVSDNSIDFTVGIEYHDHPIWPLGQHGEGYFKAELYVMTDTGYNLVESKDKRLGSEAASSNGGHSRDGDWFSTITVTRVIENPSEQYKLTLSCEIQGTAAYENATSDLFFQATQGETFLTNFTLDFVPISVVYCPPGKAMTNSLTQTTTFGTKLTIGQSRDVTTEKNSRLNFSALGIATVGIGQQSSQSMINKSQSGIQISHFRTTVVTADNSKAIGPIHWGPLGDVFVILVNSTYAASQRADGTILY